MAEIRKYVEPTVVLNVARFKDAFNDVEPLDKVFEVYVVPLVLDERVTAAFVFQFCVVVMWSK